MSPKQVELALKKQRLQLQIASQRDALAQYAVGLEPAFVAADGVRSAFHWLRRNPAVLVATGVAIGVARPKAVWRWATRGVLIWRSWLRLRSGLDRLDAIIASR
jgi:hypothetical protein